MADHNSKVTFNRVTNPDGTPQRDKDNAQPTLKPSYSARPAPNMAPPGMMGIRRQSQMPAERTKAPKQAAEPKIQFRKSKEPPNKDLWIKGRIVTMPGYTFAAKVYDAPSKHGIGEGKISKLQIKKDGKQVVNFDRGWDQRPKTAEQKEAVQRIRNGLDDTPEKKPFKGFDRNQGEYWISR